MVLVEPIYKLGEASPLADVEAFNRGELGPLRGEPPPGPEHPLPRVVLEVPHCRGGHTAKAVEKAVREAFWGRAVGCYALDAFHDDELELDLTVEVQINRGGKVTSAKSASAKSEAKKGGAKKVAKESPSCIVRRLRLLQLPGAKRGSTARVRVRIWPGDDPLPPPSDRVVPGPGAIDPDAGHAAASATLPALEACYSEARSYAPELWGRLAVRLHVDEQGKVDEAFEVETTFPDEHLRRCALAALRKATFPAPAGGDVRVVVPLRFLPQGFDGVTSGSSTP